MTQPIKVIKKNKIVLISAPIAKTSTPKIAKDNDFVLAIKEFKTRKEEEKQSATKEKIMEILFKVKT